jgi:hypothetical protein
MVVDYQPQKEEPKWIGIAVGGNLFTYKGNMSTQTANLTTPKQLWNSVLSIDGARYMCINIKFSISRQPWIIMPSSLVSLHYHTHKEFLDLNKDQRNELSEWTKANGGKKKGGGKRKGDSPRGSPKAGDSNKRFKTMISEMEGRQNKMFEAMAEVQQSSIAAIHASASLEAAKMKPMVSSALGSQGDATKEVLVERANVAMLKLNGILKSKNDGKKG